MLCIVGPVISKMSPFINIVMHCIVGHVISQMSPKDLGVTMNANMKVSEQCRIAVSKAAATRYVVIELISP